MCEKGYTSNGMLTLWDSSEVVCCVCNMIGGLRLETAVTLSSSLSLNSVHTSVGGPQSKGSSLHKRGTFD